MTVAYLMYRLSKLPLNAEVITPQMEDIHNLYFNEKDNQVMIDTEVLPPNPIHPDWRIL
jgi:hypothetical protein